MFFARINSCNRIETFSRYGKAATKKDAKSQSAAAAYLNLCPHIAPQVDTSIAADEVPFRQSPLFVKIQKLRFVNIDFRALIMVVRR